LTTSYCHFYSLKYFTSSPFIVLAKFIPAIAYVYTFRKLELGNEFKKSIDFKRSIKIGWERLAMPNLRREGDI